MRSLRVLVFGCLIVGIALLRPNLFMKTRDFTEYYSAARVLAEGGNPYDSEQLHVIQKIISGNPDLQIVISLWTPPWTLPVYYWLSWFSFDMAHLVWLFVQANALAWSTEVLCVLYFQGRKFHWPIVYGVPITFVPVLWNFHFGQNTAFLLLGIAGFLHHREAKRYLLAGGFVALTAIKPHLLAAFGILLIIDGLRSVGRRILLAGLGVIAISTVIVLSVQPAIFEMYLHALRNPQAENTIPLSKWIQPLFSYHIRMTISADHFFVQFIPCIMTCLAGVIYATVWRRERNWIQETPWIILITLICAPYGGWIFDLTLLIPVVCFIIQKSMHTTLLVRLLIFAGYLLLNYFGFVIQGLSEPWWFTPGLGLLLIATCVLHRENTNSDITVR